MQKKAAEELVSQLLAEKAEAEEKHKKEQTKKVAALKKAAKLKEEKKGTQSWGAGLS